MKRPADCGQAAAEFALLLPVLALMVMGLVDFGRAFHQYIAGANAAREAARYCADSRFRTATDAQLRAIIVTSGTSPNKAELGGRFPDADVVVRTWKTSNVTKVLGCPGAVDFEDVQAQVTIAFRPITPLIERLFPQNPLPVGGTAMMVATPG